MALDSSPTRYALPADHERRHLKYARRVVIKVGTPVVTHMDGGIAIGRISGIVEQIVQLVQRGRQVVIVTSGAIGHGLLRMQGQTMMETSLRQHMAGMHESVDLKAAAAVGQSGLMSMYDMLFREYNMTCAQILLTQADWTDPAGLSQLRDTTAELLSIGAIPIVNENDAISMRTLPVIGSRNRILWDNDEVASLLASALHADALIVLTDFEQMYRLAADGAPQPMPIFDPTATLCHPDGADADECAGKPYDSRIARDGYSALVESVRQAIVHVRARGAGRARDLRARAACGVCRAPDRSI